MGTENPAYLAADGLHAALFDLGLDGRTRQEHTMLQCLVAEATAAGSVNFHEFVFQLLPKVERQLQDMRSPGLRALFDAWDEEGHGRLQQEPCLQALRQHAHAVGHIDDETEQRFWAGFEREFPSIFSSHARYSTFLGPKVDFSAFQELEQRMQAARWEFYIHSERRSAFDAHLQPDMEAEHFGELTFLRRVFGKRAEAGEIGCSALAEALFESGVMPVAGHVFVRMRAFVKDCGELARFRFADFLDHIRRIRREEGEAREAALQKLLGGSAWPNAPPVLCDDLPSFLLQANICVDCVRSRREMAHVVEECDWGGTSAFGVRELAEVAQHASERARRRARAREAPLVASLQLGPEQLLQVRFAFASFTQTGALGISELRGLVRELDPRLSPSEADIEDFVKELQGNEQEEEQSEVEGEEQQQLAPVLHFEGYLRLVGRLMEE